MDRGEILRTMAAEVESGKAFFSTNVQAALKIRDALGDPDCHVEDAVRLVKAEPMLSARVVAMANSLAFNPTGREITDVRSAVSRLGFRVVCNLSAALLTRQMAHMAGGDREKRLAQQLWQYTAHVAALARVIARDVTHQDPETAMFAAIVHDVGGFYLLARVPAFPGVLGDGLSDDDVEGELALARALFTVLKVPASVVEAIEAFWQGYLAMPPVSLGDTLLLAADLSPVQRPLNRLAAGSREDAATRIDAVVGDGTLQQLIAASQDEVESLLGALKF